MRLPEGVHLVYAELYDTTVGRLQPYDIVSYAQLAYQLALGRALVGGGIFCGFPRAITRATAEQPCRWGQTTGNR